MGISSMRARVLVPGLAEGRLLRLEASLSFWGGVDPASGCVIATAHPQRGQGIAGRIIAMERSIGSSSGSSILLELMARSIGPAGIILFEPDQILTLGAIVGAEMGYGSIPVVQLPASDLAALPADLAIGPDGYITARPGAS
jgi:predicted aconitase with swiveling domain